MPFRKLALSIALIALSFAAQAQSYLPFFGQYGYVPTPAQWIQAWQAKQDTLGYVPLNQAGGTMTGKLYLLPSTISGAGFNIAAGATPSVPQNGDLWVTSTGLYAYINSVVIGPFVASFTLSGDVTSAGSVVTLNNVNPTSGVVGGAGLIPIVTVNQKGLVTGANITADMVGFRNRIVNGDMNFDQHNSGGAITPTSLQYVVDHWQFGGSQASKFITQQNAGSVPPPPGFNYYLGATSQSAYSVLTTDYFILQQQVEGNAIYDFNYGQASGQATALSFWVRTSVTGLHSGSIRNTAVNRSYVFSFNVPNANVWTYISILIQPDTFGTWVGASTSPSAIVAFNLGTGSTRLTSTSFSWSTNNYTGLTGAVSIVGTNGATFYVTGVQWEPSIGQSTNFERLPYSIEAQSVYRYFWCVSGYGLGLTTLNLSWSSQPTIPLPVQMRAAPTLYSGAFSVSSGNVGTVGMGSNTQMATFFNNSANWTQGQFTTGVSFSGCLTAEF